jgi:hypothetical protein
VNRDAEADDAEKLLERAAARLVEEARKDRRSDD